MRFEFDFNWFRSILMISSFLHTTFWISNVLKMSNKRNFWLTWWALAFIWIVAGLSARASILTWWWWAWNVFWFTILARVSSFTNASVIKQKNKIYENLFIIRNNHTAIKQLILQTLGLIFSFSISVTDIMYVVSM